MVQHSHKLQELSLSAVIKGLPLPSMSMARLELGYLSTATCEHLAYSNRTVRSSSAVSTTCAMCERLVHPVQTEFPFHHLSTLLLLPANTQLLKVSLREKEKQLSHHSLRIFMDSAMRILLRATCSYAYTCSIYAHSLHHIHLCEVFNEV